MREHAELREGVYLSSLDTGSTIDLETRSRHYRIEYLDGDRVRISGHPQWCPTPTLARLWLKGRFGRVRSGLHWVPYASGVRTTGGSHSGYYVGDHGHSRPPPELGKTFSRPGRRSVQVGRE
jgi:hypothetical protein